MSILSCIVHGMALSSRRNFQTNNQNVSQTPRGGGSTRLIFGYRWAAEGLKPWPCLGQKIPKIHTLFRTTPSILVPCLGQLHTNTKSIVHETPCLKNHAHCLGQTCAKLYTPFRTWDREDENRILSSGTSPYRPYKEDPPPPQTGASDPFYTDILLGVGRLIHFKLTNLYKILYGSVSHLNYSDRRYSFFLDR